MATITTERNGRKVIRFLAPNGKRPKIRLGHIDATEAAKIRDHVEHLAECWRRREPPCTGTNDWRAELLSDPARHWLYDRLAAAGLWVPRNKPEQVKRRPKAKKADKTQVLPQKLGAFLDAYIASRTDVKPGTAINYNQVRANLVEFFGAEKRLGDVTPADADEFRRFLRARLAENTTRRRCARAREFFLVAVRKRLIPENPFGHLKHLNVKSNKARQFFITQEVAYKVLDAMTDADEKPLVQWQLIFALNRFGALRCPSEISAMTWDDVDWDNSKVTVHSPKTEQYEGKESRVMPLFPELRPYLEAVFNEAESRLGRPPSATDHVLESRYRGDGKNLGTQLKRFIKRAGLTPWPKLMNNLRSSRCTELEKSFPKHAVTAWCGHSEKVAEEHYWQITDDDWARAASQTTGAIQENGGAKWGRKTPENPSEGQLPQSAYAFRASTQPADSQEVTKKGGRSKSAPRVTPTGLETETANRWQETTYSNATQNIADEGRAMGARGPDSDRFGRLEIYLDGRPVKLSEAARAEVRSILTGASVGELGSCASMCESV